MDVRNTQWPGTAEGNHPTAGRADASTAPLERFLESLPAAVWAKDADGRYLFVNGAYKTFFGLPPDLVVAGCCDDDFFAAEDAQHFRLKDREIMQTGRAAQFFEQVHLASGVKHVLTLKFPLRDAQGRPYAACGLCFDVSNEVHERQHLEQSHSRLAQREQQWLMLSCRPEIDTGDLQLSLPLIVAAARQGLNVARVSVRLWDARRERLLVQHSPEQPPALQTEPVPAYLTRAAYPAYFAALDEARAIAAADAWHDPRTAELAADYLAIHGIRSILDIPVRMDGVMAGVLCCEHIGPAREWNEAEISFAAGLADMVGRSLIAQQRRETEDALRRLNQELEARVARETEASRRAEMEARAARQQLKEITDHSPGAVCQMLWQWPGQFRFLYMSEGIARMTGVPTEAYLQTPLMVTHVILPDDFAALVTAIDAAALTPGKQFEYQFRIRHAVTNELRWLETQSRGTALASGEVLFNGSFMDVTARKQLEDAVAENERLLSAAIDGSTDGVWEWNLVTDEFYFSDNWYRQLGYAPQELPMRMETFIALCHPDDVQNAVEALNAAIENPYQAGYHLEYRLRHKDDRWQWMLGRGSVSERRADGRALRVTGTNVNIDERKQLEQSLSIATATAQKASRTKGAFLANMSHEIRTPMNAVIGLATLLRSTPLDSRQQDYLDKLLGASQSLLSLINDVLDVSRIEAGKLHIEELPFSLAATLERLRTMAGAEATAKGLKLEIEVDAEVPERLIGDAMRLGQVLLNLTGNAIKFTERGMVSLVVSRVPSADDEDVQLSILVRDTGIGISAESVGALFKPFEQADTSISRRYGGSGLGLSICHQLVSLMGGEIGVQSTPGVGSTFWFTARFGVAAPIDQALVSPPVVFARPTLQGLRVLVAEDNDINMEILTELLCRAGVEVRAAWDGGEAIEQCTEGWPELVLMDMQMPDIDGLTATAMLRADPRFAGLPIIALTANAMSEDRDRCLAAGMNDHLPKPIDVDELYAMLERWRPK